MHIKLGKIPVRKVNQQAAKTRTSTTFIRKSPYIDVLTTYARMNCMDLGNVEIVLDLKWYAKS